MGAVCCTTEENNTNSITNNVNSEIGVIEYNENTPERIQKLTSASFSMNNITNIHTQMNIIPTTSITSINLSNITDKSTEVFEVFLHWKYICIIS